MKPSYSEMKSTAFQNLTKHCFINYYTHVQLGVAEYLKPADVSGLLASFLTHTYTHTTRRHLLLLNHNHSLIRLNALLRTLHSDNWPWCIAGVFAASSKIDAECIFGPADSSDLLASFFTHTYTHTARRHLLLLNHNQKHIA